MHYHLRTVFSLLVLNNRRNREYSTMLSVQFGTPAAAAVDGAKRSWGDRPDLHLQLFENPPILRSLDDWKNSPVKTY
jgi:hypothetical protein